MARPSLGKTNKVTPENLVGLGAERLAEILVEVAETRVDLKRRLRLELTAQHGPGPLTAEIDKRLNAFETSRGQVNWRQSPAFIRDLHALRDLIVARLSPLDAGAAVERLWRFIDSAKALARRYRDRNGEFNAVFSRAAGDLGVLLGSMASGPAAAVLVDSLAGNLSGWRAWLPALLEEAPSALAVDALRFLGETPRLGPGWVTVTRQLASAAGDLQAYADTFTLDARRTPAVAADLGRRFLAAGRLEEARVALTAAAPEKTRRGRGPRVDPDWESAWIDFLEQAGRGEEAQAVRWSSFERTLSPERARDFIKRLDDFDDVEAEARAFATAAAATDFEAGLGFLMAWPALGEAARMIEGRREDIAVDPALAESWSGKLRRRYPHAALALLRGAAAQAFRRRDFSTCDRLSAEAESLEA